MRVKKEKGGMCRAGSVARRTKKKKKKKGRRRYREEKGGHVVGGIGKEKQGRICLQSIDA